MGHKMLGIPNEPPAILGALKDKLGVIPQLSGNILLAEDTKTHQQLISHHLEMTGAAVSIAENGQRAIERTMCDDFDVILMDIQMPVLDGKETIKALKQLGYSQPIYAITSNVLQSDKALYRQLGFQDVLAKPLNIDRLYNVLTKHLSSGMETIRDPSADLAINKCLDELKPFFIACLAEQFNELNNAVTRQNFIQMRKILHDIKGNAGSFGFDQLSDLANDALESVRCHQFESAKPIVAAVVLSIEEILKLEGL